MDEEYSKDMKRASRRKSDWHHAIRKKHLSRYYNWWYKSLHSYSKGKIHCSCPMCASKSKKRRRLAYGKRINWKLADIRRLEEMKEQKEEMTVLTTIPIKDKKNGFWHCSNCGRFVGYEDNDPYDENEYDNYCSKCGCRVLWENKNET